MKKVSNNRKQKNKLINAKGFTLMEVIIVIAILAILAAVAIPSITGYIERAKEVSDMQTARSIILAAQTSVVEARASGDIAPGTIITIGWSTIPTGGSSVSYGKIFIGEGSTEGEKSAILPNGYVRDKNKDFSSIRDSIIDKVGGEVCTTINWHNMEFVDFEFPESKASNKYMLYVHIDSSTGEMALAAYSTSDPNKNIWRDEIGLDITPVP